MIDSIANEYIEIFINNHYVAPTMYVCTNTNTGSDSSQFNKKR